MSCLGQGMARWVTRCTVVHKPGVGDLHFHRRWWAPWRVSTLWYQPVDRTVMHRVPDPVWEEFFAVSSFEQAMALVRGAETSPVS